MLQKGESPRPVVELNNLGKRLGSRWILAHVTAQALAGEAVLLVGSYGSGKTTLLRILATLSRPSFGSLSLFGQSDELVQCRRKVGFVSHASQLYESLSARENLSLLVSGWRLAASRIEEVLSDVGLVAAQHRPVATYSAGMKRRLMMAALFLKQPDLILLDEPWTALDADAADMVSEAIARFCKKGATVIVATHDLPRGRHAVASLPHRTWQISDGQLAELNA